jgi:hypothetical protein
VKGVRDGKRVVFRIAPRDTAARAVLASISGGRAAPPSARAPERRAATPVERAARRRAAPAATRRGLRPRRRPGLEGAIARSDLDPKARDRGAADEVETRFRDAVRIESAAELEPLMADDAPAGSRPDTRQPAQESGRTSEPEAVPSWRRSDLEDFLL